MRCRNACVPMRCRIELGVLRAGTRPIENVVSWRAGATAGHGLRGEALAAWLLDPNAK
jgi:hypothetical protein